MPRETCRDKRRRTYATGIECRGVRGKAERIPTVTRCSGQTMEHPFEKKLEEVKLEKM